MGLPGTAGGEALLERADNRGWRTVGPGGDEEDPQVVSSP